MILLSRFILKGTSQAALVAASMAMLTLVPLLGWVSVILSGAAVALVTLVHGYRHGLMVMLVAVTGTAVFASLLFGQPLMALYFLLAVWMPIWLAALVLRETVSLALSMLLVTGMSLLALLVMYLVFSGMDDYWRQALSLQMTHTAQLLKMQLAQAELQTMVSNMIRLLPLLIAGSLLASTALGLLLARWWQAVNFNPGGFAAEFRLLRVGKAAALAGVLILVFSGWLQSDVLLAMALVIMPLYLLQGLAVSHAVVAARQMNPAWLYLMYLLMFVPYIIVLLILTGLADTWLDFRRRFAG